MTIKECIDVVDNLKPNQYSIEDKVAWLSFLDLTIINDVLRTHEGYDGRYDDFIGYSADNLTIGLIVPSPYDRVYTAYLKMKIDEENGETARYNNSVTLYNSYLMEYRKWYTRNHMPLSPSDMRKPIAMPQQMDVTDAQLEQLRKLLYAQLSDDVLKKLSNDKIYAIVKSYMDTNAQMLKGKDGVDGRDGKDGLNGMDGRDGANGMDGKDGYTPQKGIDYFDGSNGLNGKDGQDGKDGKDGKDGHTPEKGVDYLTESEKEEFADVFYATYGATSFNDMMSAWKSGKTVVLKGDVESALTIRMLIHVTPTKLLFGRVLAESNLVEEVIVSSDNKWTLIKNNYVSTADLSNYKYATQTWVKEEGVNYAPKTITKVFQTTSAGVMRCETNKTYIIYCTGDTQATIRGYGSQNTDSSGNQHEISGKYLTVYCGGQYDAFTDGYGNELSNNGASLWYATAMEQGTITPIGSMNVRRGVAKHPDGDQWAEITYPSSCSIVIVETK